MASARIARIVLDHAPDTVTVHAASEDYQNAWDYSDEDSDNSLLDFDPERDHDSLMESLRNLDDFWYLGMESEPEWRTAVNSNVPSMFSVIAVENAGAPPGVAVYRSKLYQLKGQWCVSGLL